MQCVVVKKKQKRFHILFFLGCTKENKKNKIKYYITYKNKKNTQINKQTNNLFKMDSIFGPLDRKYCLFFYYIAIIFFVYMVFVIVSMLYNAVKNTGSSQYYLYSVGLMLSFALSYFQNRILYSMCIGRTADNFY